MERLNKSSIFVALLALAVSVYAANKPQPYQRFVPLGDSESWALDTHTGSACVIAGNSTTSDIPRCKDLLK